MRDSGDYDDRLAQHQLSNYTKRNRHLEHIALARDAASDKVENPKVLSFGCSLGEECFDIRDTWPNAKVYGADINEDVISKAKRRPSSKGITYFISTINNFMLHGPFDAIFAINVLCRNPETLDVDYVGDIYPFHLFESAIYTLHNSLEVGGILTIFNTNYFIEDTIVGSKYEPAAEHSQTGFVERALPNGQKVIDRMVTVNGCDYSRAEVISMGLEFDNDDKALWYRWRDQKYSAGRNIHVSSWRKVS